MTRRMIFIFGDQLNMDSAALTTADPKQDVVVMAEVAWEAQRVWSQQTRIVLFLAAMRHFADRLKKSGWQVDYHALSTEPHPDECPDLITAFSQAIQRHRPKLLCWVQPGEYQIAQDMRALAEQSGLPYQEQPDEHFLVTPSEFAQWAQGRKTWRLEHFYQAQRKAKNILMTAQGKPVGGQFNFDAKNRKSFGKQGPGLVPRPASFAPDKLTREVIEIVAARFADFPGSRQNALEYFDWPVTPAQAETALADFFTHRAYLFGDFQDAMWTDQPYLYHARISAALNLKLLNPLNVIHRAEQAYQQGEMPLAAAEGFIRQILGWREYVRGLYWYNMPEYGQKNALNAQRPLPEFYWSGQVAGEPIPMTCLDQSIGQSLRYGYAHHIQRLMVIGLFAQLIGVNPAQVQQWYLGVYVDAVEWVELPNVMGMSQYADGGVMASKPYVASGQYIRKMSNYCQHCRFNPAQTTGEQACPFTTLYWDFLLRHEKTFARHPRTALQWRHIEKIPPARRVQINQAAEEVRERYAPNISNAPNSHLI
ncbi:MAG TPA: cryptochrome/photolyase family protein [Halothiobacillaceae bacterium]|nr:cryptochrome/photolyase family protein [Halothiobacillaceae bacterium]